MRIRIWRSFDWPMFLITLALVALGVVMIYSSYEASLPPDDRPWIENAVYRQLLFAAVGLALYAAIVAVDYRVYLALYRWGYALGLLLLAVTLVIGATSFGAQSWLTFIEAFDVQASELCKVIMIIVIARLLSGEYVSLDGPLPLLSTIALMAPVAVLTYLQPDFGTALILGAIWAGMVALSSVRWQHVLLIGILGAAAAPIAWFQLKPYMQQRILSFLFPGGDPSGASYNVNQALISIGSGGWWGKGLLNGTQSQLHFLRVRHTDFIFSVLAEELGFVGAILLVLMYVLLLLRLVRVAQSAPDAAGRLIVSGVAAMLLVQTVINIGMNANILPVTGLPLPLVSYGGSSLVTTLVALALAQNVAMRSAGPEQMLLQR